MTRTKLEYGCRTQGEIDGLVVYSIMGNLFGSPEAYEFQDDVREKISTGFQKVVIDLADAEKIDSCGVGILASVMWSASQAGGGMVLVSVPEQVEKILGIVMLLDRIDHADSCDEAIAMLAPL